MWGCDIAYEELFFIIFLDRGVHSVESAPDGKIRYVESVQAKKNPKKKKSSSIHFF